jgi:hypothetical protein
VGAGALPQAVVLKSRSEVPISNKRDISAPSVGGYLLF